MGSVIAETSGWTKGLNDATNETKKFKKHNENIFESMKKSIGKRSNFGEAADILMGGGAVAVISEVGKKLNEAAHMAHELAIQYQEGKISAGEMFDKLADGIPLFGQFYQFGKEIGMMWEEWDNGADSAYRKEREATANLKSQLEYTKQRAEFSKDYNGYLEQAGQTILKNNGLWTQEMEIRKHGEEEKARLTEIINNTTNAKAKEAMKKQLADIDSVTEKLVQSDKDKKEKPKAYSGGGSTGTSFRNNAPLVFQGSTADPMLDTTKSIDSNIKNVSMYLRQIATQKQPVKVTIP